MNILFIYIYNSPSIRATFGDEKSASCLEVAFVGGVNNSIIKTVWPWVSSAENRSVKQSLTRRMEMLWLQDGLISDPEHLLNDKHPSGPRGHSYVVYQDIFHQSLAWAFSWSSEYFSMCDLPLEFFSGTVGFFYIAILETHCSSCCVVSLLKNGQFQNRMNSFTHKTLTWVWPATWKPCSGHSLGAAAGSWRRWNRK